MGGPGGVRSLMDGSVGSGVVSGLGGRKVKREEGWGYSDLCGFFLLLCRVACFEEEEFLAAREDEMTCDQRQVMIDCLGR